jgi:two-component system NtrC family sensor kinase
MRDRAGRGATKGAADEPAVEVDHETSSTRARIPDRVPAGWLDRLLVAALELPLLSGERAVVEAGVDAIAAIVPGYAVGACFVRELRSGLREQTMVKRLPEGEGEGEVQAGVDPTRIFPGFEHEYTATIPGGTAGSTLHVASHVDPLEPGSSATVHLVDRAAMALGRALAHARAVASLGASGRKASDALALEQRMLQADKLANFGQIAAGIVHELNNPLTSIVAYSEYLIRKAVSGGGLDHGDDVERLRRISESAARMLRFTRDLVSYARPSIGTPGPVVLHGVLDQAIAFCEHVLSAAGVAVERRYAVEVLVVNGAGEQLVQVFVNLLTNASQAAPARDGRVIVTTGLVSAEGGARRVQVVVEDNGSGIAAEHLPLVFVPFFTTRRDAQGTGLGLSIVKNVLESHGGEIRVESDPGRRTRFVIELPAMGQARSEPGP